MMLMVRLQILEEDSKVYIVDILSNEDEALSILNEIAKRLRAKGVDVHPVYDYEDDRRGIRIQV